jgi:hypothetical protein
LLLLVFLSSKPVNAQCDYYYWYFDEKNCIDKCHQWRYIVVDHDTDTASVRIQLEQLGYAVVSFKKTSTDYQPYHSEPIKQRYWTIIESNDICDTIEINIDKISYEGPFFSYKKQSLLGATDRFSVMLHELSDTTLLQNMTQMYGVEILGTALFTTLSFWLSCSNLSAGNALEMANLFHESGFFEWASPNLLLIWGLPIVLCDELGFSNISSIAEVQVYPNPTTGQLTINNEQLTIIGIEVFDVYGRKHEWANGRRDEGAKGVVMDISGLAAGVYFVKIRTEVGETIKKVIKQ